MYRAVTYFVDRLDGNHAYKPGDIFPRQGIEVSEERINQLLTGNNNANLVVIEEVKDVNDVKEVIEIEEAEEEVPFAPKKYTAKQLESMKVADIEELAYELGYEINATLKADIIKEFIEQQG